MKEIKPPNLLLEKIRSLKKRKADFRPHRPSFAQHSHPPPPPPPSPSFSSSSSYSAPPPAPAPASYGSPAAEPISSGYDAPAEHADEEIDLHNKEFCVDVSTYQPVVWQEVDAEQCDTVFVKQCEDKTEEVCADVTETRCQVTQSNCFK